MAVATRPKFDTREAFRANLRVELEGAIKRRTLAVGEVVADPGLETPVELPDAIAAIPVVTIRDLDDVVHDLFSTRLAAPTQTVAEVRTPATVNVWARCPNCGIHASIPVLVSPQLVMTPSGGELKLKASSKGRIHTCNQLTLDEPDGQLQAFVDEVHEDVSDDADPDEEDAGVEPGDMPAPGERSADEPLPMSYEDQAAIVAAREPGGVLECIGSNHVPGCEHFGAGTADGESDGLDDLPF